MRTRFLTKLTHREAEAYLDQNDIIFVATGTTEMHGGFPLDCETILSEAFALKLAERADGLVLPSLPYFFAGATLKSRGTVEVSVREGIDFLTGIAKSLLRQGFRRQIYISLHGPAHMTCSPLVRDFYKEHNVPILYLDMIKACLESGVNLFEGNAFHKMTVAAYKIVGRLEELPLTTEPILDCSEMQPSPPGPENRLAKFGYQSGAVGYYFRKEDDHMPTPKIATAEERLAMAEEGEALIDQIVDTIKIEEVVADLRLLDEETQEMLKDPANAHLKEIK